MAAIQVIALPTRPQPDTIVAIFLLKRFGGSVFAGIGSAHVEVHPTFSEKETFEELLAKGIVPLDIGGGLFDHHGTDACTSELVARHLDIHNDPSLKQLLAYAKRDDKEGKGTLSRDALDRAFGLSGLIAALNKSNPKNPERVVETVLPLIEAHWKSAQEHHVELPADIKRKQACGECEAFSFRQGGRTLTGIYVISDKPSMPTYLRSTQGGAYDVVVQKTEKTNHVCVLTRQLQKIDLSKVAALIRLRESELRDIAVSDDAEYLSSTGRVPELPMWYFDPATNSLLNGGAHAAGVDETRIAWDELQRLVQAGLELGGAQA